MATITEARQAASVVCDAGGEIVGRTRLQKIAFLLEAAGVGSGFTFQYKHYGPYSEDLATAVSTANALTLITEIQQRAAWGGMYSIYSCTQALEQTTEVSRRTIAEEGARADAIELELAATALFLASQGERDPWGETARRKPDKAALHRIANARELYNRLRAAAAAPARLPEL